MKKYWISLALLALVDAYLAYAGAFYFWMTAYFTDAPNVRLAQEYFWAYFGAFGITSMIMVAIAAHIVRSRQNEKRAKT